MQIHVFKNCIVFLLLCTFVVVNSGVSFGYTWCFDEDGNAKVEPASVNGCANKDSECVETLRFSKPSFFTDDTQHCNPCSDLLIEQEKIVLSKRIAKVVKFVKVLIEPNFQWVLTGPATPQNLVFRPASHAPAVDQAILVHRTVVLLN